MTCRSNNSCRLGPSPLANALPEHSQPTGPPFLVASGRCRDVRCKPNRGHSIVRRCSTRSSGTADDPFDVLVVGGGITGVGVALDAAARGLRTALVERDDFASGTSSKSSKLVHGGLRYLQQGEVRLVYEALRERQRLLQERAAPGASPAVHDPDPHQGRRRDPQEGRARRSARRCGCTTSPAAGASASSTGASRPTRRSPTCPRMPRSTS